MLNERLYYPIQCLNCRHIYYIGLNNYQPQCPMCYKLHRDIARAEYFEITGEKIWINNKGEYYD